MNKLLIDEHPLQVLPTLAVYIGLNEAIILQQIHYWLRSPKVGETANGYRWVRNTVKQWQSDNFPFWDEQAIKRGIANLENDGLILSTRKLNKRNYDRTKWYTIDYEALNRLTGPVARLIEKSRKRAEARAKQPRTVQNVPNDRTVQNVPIMYGTKCTDESVQNVPTYTRDYTETTSENQKEKEADQNFSKICKLYQSEIGFLSPLINDQIKDDIDTYPPEWFEPAISRAVEQNKRTWAYVRGILKNWQRKGGPQNDAPPDRSNGNGRKPIEPPQPSQFGGLTEAGRNKLARLSR